MTTVLSSAQLNITGSLAQRDKLAKALRKDCNQWLYSTLSNKKLNDQPNELRLSEITDYFKAKYQDICCEVGERKHKMAKETQAYVTPFLKNDKISGFYMGLDFKPNSSHELAIDKTEYKNFLHEFVHFCDYVTKPKFNAKKVILLKTFPESTKRETIANFYNTVLYNHFVDASTTKPPKKERCQNIKTNTQNFLAQNIFSSEEKIALLQHWRHGLKTEKNAYNAMVDDTFEVGIKLQKQKLKKGDSLQIEAGIGAGFLYDSEKFSPEARVKELLKVAKKQKMHIHKKLEETFLFTQKIKILESLLANEIKDHRANHAKQLKEATSDQSSSHIRNLS